MKRATIEKIREEEMMLEESEEGFSEDYVDELLEGDEISPREHAFTLGFDRAG